MDIEKLEKILKEDGQPKFRLDQIIKAVYVDGVLDFSEVTNLPKDLREKLGEQIKIVPFSEEKIFVSEDEKSAKALLSLTDGEEIETVLMNARADNWTVCVSSQVGCPMQCAFCATGENGFKRNLTQEEILGQILFWKNFLRKKQASGRLSNVVYMGMGEPFLNWEEVKKSLKTLMHLKFFNLGARSISVSTVGIRGAIEKCARDFPQVNLAISLHFTEDKIRQSFMPAAKNYPLAEMKKDLDNYFEKSNRKVFLEYVMFRDLNDSEKDALSLVSFIKKFKKPHLLHVNLIRYNETSGAFRHAPLFVTQKFKSILLKSGINVTERKSLGEEIFGACGQLSGKAPR